MTEHAPERPRRRAAARAVFPAVAALALLGATGCATNDYPELPPASRTAADASAEADFDYLIGPGDELEIFVWGYEDLSVVAPVRPDGRITTRLVEDLQASGRTPTELAREIETAYEEYVNKPVVTVGVAGFAGSADQRIRVVDAAGDARSVAYSNGMTMLDLLVAIGGMGEFASGNRTVLVRGRGEARTSYRVRAGDLVGEADMSADVALRPGDVVIIPRSWF